MSSTGPMLAAETVVGLTRSTTMIVRMKRVPGS
jgi:hypothetical protein